MSRKNLVVVARVKAKPGKENILRETLIGLLEPTRKEEGCIQYELHQNALDPGRFLMHEVWESKKHLDNHLSSPHLKSLTEKGPNILDGPPELTLWEKID